MAKIIAHTNQSGKIARRAARAEGRALQNNALRRDFNDRIVRGIVRNVPLIFLLKELDYLRRRAVENFCFSLYDYRVIAVFERQADMWIRRDIAGFDGMAARTNIRFFVVPHEPNWREVRGLIGADSGEPYIVRLEQARAVLNGKHF